MSARNLLQNSHFLEMASSSLLALKLSGLMLAISWFGDTPFALALICIVFATGARLIERRLDVQDESYRVLVISGLVCVVLSWTNLASTGFVRAIPLVALFLFYLVHSMKRRPFAELYAKVDGIPVLRQQQSTLWLEIYGVSALMWLLLPGAAVWITPLLAIGALVAHGYMQLVGFGPAWEPSAERQMEEFRFVLIANTEQGLEPLYRLYVKELMPTLVEGDSFHSTSQEEIVRKKMEMDRPLWPHMLFFAAYHEDKLVGTLSCQFDNPPNSLPFEDSHSQPFSLDRIREIGSIVELGRFCVAEDFRLMPEIFSGLLICAVEFIMARDVAFVAVQSVLKSARIYSKMGFMTMTKEPVTNLDHGVKVQLLMLNMAARGDADNPIMGNATDLLSQYVFCRFIWRNAARATFGQFANRTFPANVRRQDVPGLVVFRESQVKENSFKESQAKEHSVKEAPLKEGLAKEEQIKEVPTKESTIKQESVAS